MEHMCLTGKGVKCVCVGVGVQVCVFLIDLLMSLGAEADQQPPVALADRSLFSLFFGEARENITESLVPMNARPLP